ncbi:hypothetical protein LTR78_001300 [Recurvomyces mirabilis]|uniref:Uncharacterized protein n=1 Tax=Recurvomyces mirabilis TaxID=574656 RepID=A0AAE0WV55_9PEZI|nr:hypothetical protein LTR78_001300 [Recurvomyces mirabilis]KAK5161277.1 hypothetical protein LTS14_001073 [Recurvomyces mirabilis]
MRHDLDEEMEQLESGKSHESQERQITQRQLGTERKRCAARGKRLRVVRLQLAELDAVDRATIMRSKTMDMSLAEAVEGLQDDLAVQAHILALVCRRDRGANTTTTKDMWKSLADGLVRDQKKKSQMLVMQKLEHEVQTEKQETEKDRDKIVRLQRAILFMVRDGPKKEKLAGVLEELVSGQCSRRESAVMEASSGNKIPNPRQARLTVSTSEERKADTVGLIDGNEAKRKKVRGIRPSWAYCMSEQRMDDLTNVQPHSLLSDDDMVSARASAGSDNSSDELETQNVPSAAAKAGNDSSPRIKLAASQSADMMNRAPTAQSAAPSLKSSSIDFTTSRVSSIDTITLPAQNLPTNWNTSQTILNN